MSKDALTIQLSQLAGLLEGIGIEADVHDICSIHIQPGKITVVRYRVTPDGHRVIINGHSDLLAEPATEATTIAVLGVMSCPWCPLPNRPEPTWHPGGSTKHTEPGE